MKVKLFADRTYVCVGIVLIPTIIIDYYHYSAVCDKVYDIEIRWLLFSFSIYLYLSPTKDKLV